MKIAVVTCYDQNDYVRARVLRTAFSAVPDVEAVIMRNEHTGVPARYLEMMWRILVARFTIRPDVYVITFRGYEMLLFMALTFVRKPIVFDEMVNMTESYVEKGVIKPGTFKYRAQQRFYEWLTHRAKIILADTDAHAEYSATLNKLSNERYRVLPVGTDETVFYPREAKKAEPFTVFYYGHMLPLHGLSYVLDAATMLKDNPEVRFRFVGGKQKDADAIAEARAKGANIIHEKWLPFEQLPEAASEAGLTLGGPFGGTLQSQYVITGKTYQFLALGVPVLVGANKVQEGFADKQNCLIVPQADAGALAAAITWAQQHPEDLKAIGTAGRKLYEQHFSQAVVNHRIAQLVKELK